MCLDKKVQKFVRIAFVCSIGLGIGHACGQQNTISDASGIARANDRLLIVGDDESGVYYSFRLPSDARDSYPIDAAKTQKVRLSNGSLASDLEAIDVLADGRVVVVSERLASLIDDTGVVAEYDHAATEFGSRGLEGLAVRRLGSDTSRVAVLWEGGYPEYEDVPAQLRNQIGRTPLRPVVWIHDVDAGERNLQVKSGQAQIIELAVPKPAGREPDAQRFRAPDLVWHQTKSGSWGFIVLLSSQNSPEGTGPSYEHQWLQQFSVDGRPLGNPHDLKKVLPAHLADANWEGLSWFEDRVSLVLIHDKPPTGQPMLCTSLGNGSSAMWASTPSADR